MLDSCKIISNFFLVSEDDYLQVKQKELEFEGKIWFSCLSEAY